MVGMGIRMMMVPVVIMPMRMVVMMVMRVLMVMVVAVIMVVIVRVVVIMVVRMIVIMVVPVRMIAMRMQGRPRQTVLLAELLVSAGGIAVALARAVFQAAADALDMVMVAFLRAPDICLKAKHLLAVLAHLAVHVVGAFEDFVDPAAIASITSGWSLR